jgi:transposase-like protein
MCQAGERSVSSIAREYDVHVNLLFRWIREFGAVGDSNLSPQMLPVSVTDDDIHNAISADAQPHGSPSRNRTGMVDACIVLTTRNGCSLQIIGRPDDELLRRVLQMAFA